MRLVSGVILGYLVFGLSAFALFRITHHDPHVPASITFEIFTIVYGILFALLAGYVGCALAGRRDLLAAWIVAAIVALGAMASMIATGISWSPMAGLLLMAPMAVVGGWWCRQRRAAKSDQR
jgi:hypothetical protein